MTTHPNRSKNRRGFKASPTKAEIRKARERADLDEAQAAAVIHCTQNGWIEWESGRRRMHPAFFELFVIKTSKPFEDRLDALEAARS